MSNNINVDVNANELVNSDNFIYLVVFIILIIILFLLYIKFIKKEGINKETKIGDIIDISGVVVIGDENKVTRLSDNKKTND